MFKMATYCLAIIAICLLPIGCSREVPAENEALVVKPPTGWHLEHQTAEGLDFYSLRTDSKDHALLMFSKWPPPSKPDEIPSIVQTLAEGFLDQAKESTEFSLVDERYEIEQFSGDHCKGSYAVFRIETADTHTVQTMFMMSVDGQIWNGQFTGPSERWIEALKLLTTIKTKS